MGGALSLLGISKGCLREKADKKAPERPKDLLRLYYGR